MFNYIYVKAKVGGSFATISHREIIDQYSKDGWRFVTAIPLSSGGYGQIISYDLVFEKNEIHKK